MKFLHSALWTLLFLFVLGVTYVVHATQLRVDVVFYSALLDALVATVICALALAGWVRKRRAFSALEACQLVLIWALLGYVFAISVPTVIDRSLSFYILEKLEQRGGGIRADAMASVFVDEYLHEHRLVDVRLTEQMQSGTLVIENGCVLLTDKGRRIAAASRWFRTHLLPKQRLLMGEYSDALTDPFRASAASKDYACGPEAGAPR